MGKLVIERKKAIDLRMPYSVLVDGNLIGEIENGQTKEFEVQNGEHTIIITSNQENFMEQVGGISGGLLGMLIGKGLDKVAKKNKKNEAKVSITEDKKVNIVCKAGAFDAVIHKVD